MRDFLTSHYLVFKSLHLIFMVFWMASLFFLPRLFVYHVRALPGSETSNLIQGVEKRLIRLIMTPSMVMTWVWGLCLLAVNGILSSPLGWLHLKILFVLLLSFFHGFFVMRMKDFERGENTYSETFYRVIGEIPPFLFIFIVFCVVLKPF